MNSAITVAIPAHPARITSGMLDRAVASVWRQDLPAAALAIAHDTNRAGAATTRQRALEMVTTPWVAFLDSDDEFLPQHLAALSTCAAETGADYVFSYFLRSQGGDPLHHFGKPFNPEKPHHTTSTVLVRTSVAKAAGFTPHPDANKNWPGEDWQFTLRCVELGAHIVHHPEETWCWHRHAGNTSGLPNRGDA